MALDINKFIRTDDEGKTVVDIDAYNKALESHVDSRIGSAVDKYKSGSLRNELKKELEAEINMTAEEALKKEREEFENYKKEQTLEIIKNKSKSVLATGGFNDDEIDEYLKLVTDNEGDSLATMNKFVELRAKLIEDTKKQAIENLQKKEPETAKSTVTFSGSEKDAPKSKRATREEIMELYK